MYSFTQTINIMFQTTKLEHIKGTYLEKIIRLPFFFLSFWLFPKGKNLFPKNTFALLHGELRHLRVSASIHLLSRFSRLSSSGCQNFSKSVLQENLTASWALQCNIFTVLSWFINFKQIPFLVYDRLVIIRNYPWCLLIKSGCSRGQGTWCCHIIFWGKYMS